jgi:hypothetical protein
MVRSLLTLFKVVWALPNTALGVILLPIAMLFGVTIRRVAGVVEVHGTGSAWLLRNLVPLKGGAAAITLGHVVYGRDEAGLARCRAHERAHMRQCERWGPFFIPAYLLASLVAFAQGGHAYRDNGFERQARAEEAEYPARPSA